MNGHHKCKQLQAALKPYLVEKTAACFGPTPKSAPPRGPVYTDKECMAFGLTTLELQRWTRTQGIARSTDRHTPEDHIGLNKSTNLLMEYLQKRLPTWSSHFLDELAETAQRPFYHVLPRSCTPDEGKPRRHPVKARHQIVEVKRLIATL